MTSQSKAIGKNQWDDFTGAGIEFPGEYRESTILEERENKRKEKPKQIKSRQREVRKEFERTQNEPTGMQ